MRTLYALRTYLVTLLVVAPAPLVTQAEQSVVIRHGLHAYHPGGHSKVTWTCQGEGFCPNVHIST